MNGTDINLLIGEKNSMFRRKYRAILSGTLMMFTICFYITRHITTIPMPYKFCFQVAGIATVGFIMLFCSSLYLIENTEYKEALRKLDKEENYLGRDI